MFDQKKNSGFQWGLVVLGIAIIAAIILTSVIASNPKVAWVSGTPVSDLTAFLKILGTVLVLAIIVERLVEAFVADPDKSQKEKISKEITITQNAIEEQREDVLNLMTNESDKNEIETVLDKTKELSNLRNDRRKKVVPLALGIGMVVSMSGVVFIEQLIQLPDTAQAGQKGFFHFVDILLSGTLIGGGSDFIHYLINVIKSNKA